MSIDVFCSQCKKTYRVKDELAGRRGKCPQGHVVVVPQRKVDAASAAPASGAREVVPAAGKEAGKTCPGCAAALPENAVLCVQCGYDFRTGKRLATGTTAKVATPPRRPIALYAGIGGGAVAVIAVAFFLLRGGPSDAPKTPENVQAKIDPGVQQAQSKADQDKENAEKVAAQQAEEARLKAVKEKEAQRLAEEARLNAEKEKLAELRAKIPPWQTDFEEFIKLYQANALDHFNSVQATFSGRAVRWSLVFKEVKKGRSQPYLEFDGLARNLGGTGGLKGPVAWFEPAPTALAKWQATAPGTRVTFIGRVDLSMPSVIDDRNTGQKAPGGATVVDLVPTSDGEPSAEDVAELLKPAAEKKPDNLNLVTERSVRVLGSVERVASAAPQPKTVPEWQTDPQAFIKLYPKAVISGQARALFHDQPIQWSLVFNGVKQTSQETVVEFEGLDRPKGDIGLMLGRPFNAFAYFYPASDTLPQWKALKAGAKVSVKGKIDLSVVSVNQPINTKTGERFTVPSGAKIVNVMLEAADAAAPAGKTKKSDDQ